MDPLKFVVDDRIGVLNTGRESVTRYGYGFESVRCGRRLLPETDAPPVDERPEDQQDSPTNVNAAAELIYDSAIRRLEPEESIAFTSDGGFQGTEGFTKIMNPEYPTWSLGSLLGIELLSMADGESRWMLEAGPEHPNPMGTIHGGVLCDLGGAALSTAYMSTVTPDESFTTVDLTVNYLRPVWSGRLEAVGRVVHKGQTIGVAERDIATEEGALVARLSGTCMTLRQDSANRTAFCLTRAGFTRSGRHSAKYLPNRRL